MNKIAKLRQFIDNRLEWDLGANPALDFPKQSRSPVFILCPARSGSTLLRVMLGGARRLPLYITRMCDALMASTLPLARWPLEPLVGSSLGAGLPRGGQIGCAGPRGASEVPS